MSRINWCQGHWFCSTYMVVRLSNVSSIYCKKCIFSVFCSKVFHLIYFYCEKKHLCTKKFKMQGFPSWHKWKYHVFCSNMIQLTGKKSFSFHLNPEAVNWNKNEKFCLSDKPIIPHRRILLYFFKSWNPIPISIRR